MKDGEGATDRDWQRQRPVIRAAAARKTDRHTHAHTPTRTHSDLGDQRSVRMHTNNLKMHPHFYY